MDPNSGAFHPVTTGRCRADVAAVLLILACPFAAFAPALSPSQTLSPADIVLEAHPWKALAPDRAPANPLMGDVAFMFHPWLLYGAREVAHGRLPLWNPHAFAGAPAFANPQTAYLFPLHWLMLVLGAPLGVTIITLLKLVIAGVGTYAFLRLVPVSPLPALLGAIAFMWSGPLVVWMQWSYGSTMATVPVLMVATEMFVREPRRRRVAILALALALVILSGYPQGAFVAIMLAGAWAASRSWRRAAIVPTALRFGLAGTLGLGLAAVQILPFVEYLFVSSVFFQRNALSPPRFFPVEGALTALMPLLFGIPTQGNFSGPLNFNEIQVHVGVPALLTASLAASIVVPKRAVAFSAVVLVVGVSVVYDLPPLSPLLSAVPPFSLIASQRCLPAVMFAVAMLAALTLDGLGTVPTQMHPLRTRFTLGLWTTVFGVAAGILAWSTLREGGLRGGLVASGALVAATMLLLLHQMRRGGMTSRLGLVALEVISVVPIAMLYQPSIPSSLFYPAPPAAIRYVQTETAATKERVINIGWNLGSLYGLYDVRGYDGMTPRWMEQLVGPGTVGPLGNGGMDITISPELPLFDLLGIRYVVTGPGAPAPRVDLLPVYEGADGRVYRNDRALPRAFVVHGRRCADDASQLRLLHGHDVDLRSEVLLSDCPRAPASGPPGNLRMAELVDYQPQVVRVRAESDRPGYLVLTDTWFPGWRATVDGRPARVWRANYAVRAVWIPPGRHDVVLQYAPLILRVGVIVTAASACIVLVLLLPFPKALVQRLSF